MAKAHPKRRKRFRAEMYAVVDMEDTYEPTLYTFRRWAVQDKRENSHLKDARWKIVRVLVTERTRRGK